MPTQPLHIIILAAAILAAAILAAAAFALFRFYRHQCLLRDRAHLMREAVRNRDFTFRLPVRGLFFGERAMQQALNDMSLDIKALEARKEVLEALANILLEKRSMTGAEMINFMENL